MKALVTAAVLMAAIAMPQAATAGPVEELDAILLGCDQQRDASCAENLWGFIDVAADDRLAPAELSRFMRIFSEWIVLLEARQGGGVATDSDRLGATGAGFLSGPLAAYLIVANYDYDGDGVISRGELFLDSDEDAFVESVMTEADRLPQHAAMLFMRALEAQEGLGLGDLAPAEPGADVAVGAGPASAGFELRNVQQTSAYQGGAPVINLSGEVVNRMAEPSVVPTLVARIVGADGTVLRSDRFEAWQTFLEAYGTARFTHSVADLPAGAADIRVEFATE